MSKWKDHKSKWCDCTDCELSQVRNNVVLFKGNLPCDVLFIGEAPGASEDVLGKPFVGPAGILLDEIVGEALGVSEVHLPLPIGWTQLVGCVPKINGTVTKEIPEESIKSCSKRLSEVYELANPSLVVCVGKLAMKWFPYAVKDPLTTITDMVHPAALLTADKSRQQLAIQREVVRLSDSLVKVFN